MYLLGGSVCIPYVQTDGAEIVELVNLVQEMAEMGRFGTDGG